MIIKEFKSKTIFAASSYLVIDNDEGLLIDCGFFDDEIRNAISELKFFHGVILTHKHFDHIRGLTLLKEYINDLKVYSYIDNYQFLENPQLNCSQYMTPLELVSIKNIKLIPINEGNVNIGIFALNIIYTPGHTSDSISILIKNSIFVGDLLFHSGVGRYDLPSANYYQLIKSLSLIKSLFMKNNFQVYFGHDSSISSDELIKINEYIKEI